MKPPLAEIVVINSAEMIWLLIEIAGFEMSITYLSAQAQEGRQLIRFISKTMCVGSRANRIEGINRGTEAEASKGVQQ